MHRIVQENAGSGINTATFSSRDDFLDFTIKGAKELAGKRQADVSMLLPRAACTLSGEDVADGISGFAGRGAPPRTKPVRVEASLIYTKTGDAWQLTDATISHIESTK
jgi:hypothetical protein